MSYDRKRLLTLVGATLAGTAAAAAAIHRIRMPKAGTVEGATVVATTGGTAAGPGFTIGKSLAGTGAVSNFATHTFGTDADNTSAALTVAKTDLAANDHLVVNSVAGTAASSPVIDLAIEWVDGVG